MAYIAIHNHKMHIWIICCGWMTSKYLTFCLNFYGVFCILLTSVSISSNFSLIFWSRRPIMLFKRFGGAADQRSRRRSGGKGAGASEILISGRFSMSSSSSWSLSSLSLSSYLRMIYDVILVSSYFVVKIKWRQRQQVKRKRPFHRSWGLQSVFWRSFSQLAIQQGDHFVFWGVEKENDNLHNH